MKKTYLLLLLFFSTTLAYSWPWSTEAIPTSTNENGDIIVSNEKDNIEDKIRIGNDTNDPLNVIIKGKHKKNGLIEITTGPVGARDSRYFDSQWTDKLEEFTQFYISIEGGKITKHHAEVCSDDLLFHIYETDIITDNSILLSPADELIKWKQLLDMGGITQEEYEAKKKQLLGL